MSENPIKGPVEDGLCESKVGTRNGLSENLTKEQDTIQKENISEKCYKCKKIVNKELKINTREGYLLNSKFSYYSCC